MGEYSIGTNLFLGVLHALDVAVSSAPNDIPTGPRLSLFIRRYTSASISSDNNEAFLPPKKADYAEEEIRSKLLASYAIVTHL